MPRGRPTPARAVTGTSGSCWRRRRRRSTPSSSARPTILMLPAASMALQMKKHVYCEKPLTHTIYEARRLAELAAENNLVTQMGTQIHAEENYRLVVELVQSGAIGEIREVHVWVNVDYSGRRMITGKPRPGHVDWDLWAGSGSGPSLLRECRGGRFGQGGPPVQLALVLGLRHRRPGRLRLPLDGPPSLGAGSQASDAGDGGRSAAAPGERDFRPGRDLRVSRPGVNCRR